MTNETDTQKIVVKILEKMRPEALANEMEISIGKVNLWRYGKRSASKSDTMYLNQILRRL